MARYARIRTPIFCTVKYRGHKREVCRWGSLVHPGSGTFSHHCPPRCYRLLELEAAFQYSSAVRTLRESSLVTSKVPAARLTSSLRHTGRRRAPLSTLTVTDDGQVVPWLAAAGPLSYSPADPPEHDYYFQYNRILPGIFSEYANLRRQFCFGAANKANVRGVLEFWELARARTVNRVAFQLGSIRDLTVVAPLAVYRMMSRWRDDVYVFIQHGSYQVVSVADQPEIETGMVMLYRGIEKSPQFRCFRPGILDDQKRDIWQRYMVVQAYVLTDSVRSFNSIHDRTKRCETTHIRDGSWITNEIARERGLDIKDSGFTEALWTACHQSFALERNVAKYKFGPNYVVCRAPVGNIRITTCFAGEHEARIVDPRNVDMLECNRCRVVEYSG